MAKIFISYAREDFEIAKRLYEFLLSQGQEPWLDKECILPGQKWESAIKSAINECHFFIALLSPNSIEKRGYVQKELREGLEVLDRVPDSQIFLIPVRISECEPTHDRLREIQWLDLFPNWEDGLRRLSKVFTFVPKQVLVPNLSGSKWSLTETISRMPCLLSLEEDGSVTLDDGEYYSSTKWWQSGNIIYMEFTEKYAQYKGIVEGNRITGEAQNVRGQEWRWEAVEIEREVLTPPNNSFNPTPR